MVLGDYCMSNDVLKQVQVGASYQLTKSLVSSKAASMTACDSLFALQDRHQHVGGDSNMFLLLNGDCVQSRAAGLAKYVLPQEAGKGPDSLLLSKSPRRYDLCIPAQRSNSGDSSIYAS